MYACSRASSKGGLFVASRSSSFRRYGFPLSVAALIAVFLVSLAGYMPLASPQGQQYTANAYVTISSAFGFVRDEYVALATRIFPTKAPANVQTVPIEPDVANDASRNGSVSGMAIMPSTGSTTADSQAVKSIQSTFSDQVLVDPDQSGTAGVITPVFRTGKGNDFVYVMVPVKDQHSPP